MGSSIEVTVSIVYFRSALISCKKFFRLLFIGLHAAKLIPYYLCGDVNNLTIVLLLIIIISVVVLLLLFLIYCFLVFNVVIIIIIILFHYYFLFLFLFFVITIITADYVKNSAACIVSNAIA